MYSFRKDFDDKREEVVKLIPGYEKLTSFFERAINLSLHSKDPRDVIGGRIVSVGLNQEKNEKLKAEWNFQYGNGESIDYTEYFTNDCNVEDLKKIIKYILKRDNLDFKIVLDFVDSKRSGFQVFFYI